MTAAGVARPPVSSIDEIRALAVRPGPVCGPSLFIATLPPEDAAAIQTAYAEGIAMSVIGRWMQGRGFGGKEEAVAHHLRGRCGCQRP